MEQQKKRKKRKKNKRLRLIILLGLAAAMISGVILWNTRITDIKVYGNDQYTEEEIKNMIFEKTVETRFLYAWFVDKFKGHKSFPRIHSYQLKFDSMNQVEIIVEENKMIGCVDYMGSYLYFDKMGVIVESTTTPYENIPVVEGLTFKKILLYQKLETEPENIFEDIVKLTQKLKERGLIVDIISYDYQGSIQLKMGDIQVILGDNSYLEEKLTELYAMQEPLKGQKGTLHLEDYDVKNSKSNYFFELDEGLQEKNE